MKIVGKILLGLVMMAGLAALLFTLAGYFKKKISDKDVAQVVEKEVPKNVASVQEVKWRRFETAVGTIRAVQESAVASKILARVLEVRIKAGQPVSKDEVLIRLDDSDLSARLKQAEAAATASVVAREKASADMSRDENLKRNRAISDAEYEATSSRLRSAKAEEERTIQMVNEARIIMSYATIRAPMSGIVIDKRVEVGDTVTPGQILFTVYDPTRMQLLATVRESMALRLKVGQVISSRLDALNYSCDATISEIVPEAQASSRSFLVKVTGPCPPGVYSGMFGRISIPLGEETVTVVPQDAVYRIGQLDMVDVVAGKQVQRRIVQLGRMQDKFYEVLSGLKPDEKVVLRQSISEQGGNR